MPPSIRTILRPLCLAMLGWAAVVRADLPSVDDVTSGDGTIERRTADGATVEERRRHYALDASDVDGLRRQLDSRGPRNRFGHPASALTTHALTAEYRLVPSADGCTIVDVAVRVAIDIRLPQWTPTRTPPPSLVEQWQRLERDLIDHELGHRDNGVWAADEYLRRLRALPPQRGCGALGLRARAERDAVVLALEAREAEYDARTDFSRAQRPQDAARAREEEAREREARAERDRARAHRQLRGF
jgi:predicted secreted Zn-dependent protease